MLLIISPAKTLDESPSSLETYTAPQLLEYSKTLVKKLKTLHSKKLQELMDISKNIADLNVERNQNFSFPFDRNNAKQAILAFKGDVYQGLAVEDFSAEDLAFAQEHLGILSGLYGFLRPLDLMKPYRLEMGTALKVGRASNLYNFWKSIITNQINATNSKVVVNLASNEYFKAIKTKELTADLWSVNFKENRNGQYKMISFSAKKARGMMCRYVIKNRLQTPEELKSFDLDGYHFNEALSLEKDLMFTR